MSVEPGILLARTEQLTRAKCTVGPGKRQQESTRQSAFGRQPDSWVRMARIDRKRPDHFAKRAKAEGYAARSVYKLSEIDRRYRVLDRVHRCLLYTSDAADE